MLRAALIWGMGIQVLLGLAWLIKNMGGMQNFQESNLLLFGKTAAYDFYSGILYRAMAALLASYPWVLYGIQLAAALASAYWLLSCFFYREKKALLLLGALSLITIPQAMQCHLAVLPWSLGTSLLLGETALWRRARNLRESCGGAQDGRMRGHNSAHGMKEESACKSADEEKQQAASRRAVGKTAALMLLGWGLLLLILPVYAWFVLPMLWGILWQAGKNGRKAGRRVCALTAGALLLCCVTVNCGWNPAHWNRRLAADALSRAGWPQFQYIYEGFPPELHDGIGLVTAREVSAYADGVDRVLIPVLEEKYGAGETTALLWELAGICLRDNLRADVKNIVWDLAAYHATPPILSMQLKGRAYDSYSGINYEHMRSRAPLLTRYYVAYGGRWWWMMLALAGAARLFGARPWGLSGGKGPECGGGRVCAVEGRSRGAGARRLGAPRLGARRLGAWRPGAWKLLQCWLPILAGAEWMILCFTLGGSGIMDYKKTLWVTILWYVAALGVSAGEEGSGKWQL